MLYAVTVACVQGCCCSASACRAVLCSAIEKQQTVYTLTICSAATSCLLLALQQPRNVCLCLHLHTCGCARAAQVELAKRLVHNSFADKAFFCNSGTEANEGAIKFARKFARVQAGIDPYDATVRAGSGSSLAAAVAAACSLHDLCCFHIAAGTNNTTSRSSSTVRTCTTSCASAPCHPVLHASIVVQALFTIQPCCVAPRRRPPRLTSWCPSPAASTGAPWARWRSPTRSSTRAPSCQ